MDLRGIYIGEYFKLSNPAICDEHQAPSRGVFRLQIAIRRGSWGFPLSMPTGYALAASIENSNKSKSPTLQTLMSREYATSRGKSEGRWRYGSRYA